MWTSKPRNRESPARVCLHSRGRWCQTDVREVISCCFDVTEFTNPLPNLDLNVKWLYKYCTEKITVAEKVHGVTIPLRRHVTPAALAVSQLSRINKHSWIELIWILILSIWKSMILAKDLVIWGYDYDSSIFTACNMFAVNKQLKSLPVNNNHPAPKMLTVSAVCLFYIPDWKNKVSYSQWFKKGILKKNKKHKWSYMYEYVGLCTCTYCRL